MTAAAEILSFPNVETLYDEPWVVELERPNLYLLPDISVTIPAVGTEQVIAIPDMPEDQLSRKRAEHLIQRVAAVVVSNEVIIAENEKTEIQSAREYTSLDEAIYWAADGDPVARKLVETNVRSDMIERTYKAGIIVSTELAVNEQGKIVQYGQTLDTIHINGLRFASDTPEMRERAEPETRNSVRMEQAHRQGLLQDHYFVVFSRYTDTMTEQQASDAGFFADTKSCAIQTTTQSEHGLAQESAFVAGVYGLNGMQHDVQTINSVGQNLGVSFEGKSAAQVIDTPLLVPKWMMPNGAVDLVRMYDAAAGNTFFGEDKPVQDYTEYQEFCRNREANLEPSVQVVVDQLLAAKDSLRGRPVAAVQLLNELSQVTMVDYAIDKDKTIDSRVFGVTAAAHIEESRYWLQIGDMERAGEARGNAQQTAESNSCPTAFSQGEKNNSPEAKAGDDKDCLFISKKCPLCGTKDVLTTVTSTHIKGSCGCSKKKSK